MELIRKGEIAFVRMLIPVCLGILIARFSSSGLFQLKLSGVLASLLGLAFLITLLVYKRHKLYLVRWRSGFLVHCLVLCLSFCITISKDSRIFPDHFSKFKDELLIVKVNSEPKRKADILRFDANVERGYSRGSWHNRRGILLVALKSSDAVRYGDLMVIPSGFTQTEPPYNPYEFDYRGYLANHGVFHQTFINREEVRILGSNHGNWLIAKALSYRQRLVEKITAYIENAEAAAVLSTLILGFKADLSQEVIEAYSKTGTMHVLSVSGMHVNIVFILLSGLLWFMDKRKALRLVRAALIICLIWSYALITGFSPSVCRAALMLSIYVLGKAIHRSSNSYNLIAASALLLLAYNPYFLLDTGFQLSYLAVIGLIYFYPKIYRSLYVKNWMLDKIWAYTALSIAAQIATFPLALYYFHQFPLYFLISNLFIVLPVTIIMYAGIAFLFIPYHSWLQYVGKALGEAVSATNKGLFIIEELPLASIKFYDQQPLFLIGLYVFIFGFFLSIQLRNRSGFLAVICLGTLLMSYLAFASISRRLESTLTFYSLRKHSAFSFVNANREWIYSDANSNDRSLNFSIGAAVDSKADTIQFGNIYQHDNFFRFQNYKLLVWDKRMDGLIFGRRIKVEGVLLSGRPKSSIKEIRQFVDCKMLLVDATNSDYQIKRWKEEAETERLKLYVLKKQPAYTIRLESSDFL